MKNLISPTELFVSTANTPGMTRRRFLQAASSLGLTFGGVNFLAPSISWAQTGNTAVKRIEQENADLFELVINRATLAIDKRKTTQAITINGLFPGPMIRMRQGRDAIIRVTNQLAESTSIHWHGILLPYQMDGVPGISFSGIAPGETFEYRFPVRQSGTYWYHSHSGMQEQLGHYGPLVIEPAEPQSLDYQRDYAIVLSDWTFENPATVMRNLKVSEGYYNYNQRTVEDFFNDVQSMGWNTAWQKSAMWGQMRMSPRDILDVTGAEYTYLINGFTSGDNWTGLFNPGEKVRLRFINASAMTFFDVKIPGLAMTVIAADGQSVQAVEIDEFRMGVAETYDVIVEPTAQAHTIFAQAQDRSGFTCGTLAIRAGITAAIPTMYPRPERGMDSMGMEHSSMERSSIEHSSMEHSSIEHSSIEHSDIQHSGMDHTSMKHSSMKHSHNDTMATPADSRPYARLDDPGVGFEQVDHRVLTYSQLKSIHGWPDKRRPEREIELHLTGNMQRYMWSFDGKKFSEVDGPIRFYKDERLRLILVNNTMMDHPIHLHGMWMELETGAGDNRPRKHTIIVKPGERISALITADAYGDWAFHCHLMYHMEAGMFRVVSVA